MFTESYRARVFVVRLFAIVSLVFILSACGGNGKKIELNFKDDWQAGFSDYPVGEEEFYQLSSQYKRLPPPLADMRGLNVSGNNHSDDLFMFVTKRFTGLEPNTQYQLEMEITFATNAPSGCIGIGGAPGEGVAVKAGATAMEPRPYDDGSGFYLMNIDKGNQMSGGSDAIVLGDFANSKDCEELNFTYELKTLANASRTFTVHTDANGILWLLFGTDSGFEGTTSIYYVSGSVLITEL